MKKGLLIIAAIVAIAIAGIGFWRYEPKIHNKLIVIKEKLHNFANYKSMHRNVEQIAQLPNVIVNGDEWFFNRTIISHAGGGINGCSYTNSLEAWEHSYACGNRLYDADITFTTDSVPVLKHSWTDNLEQTDLSMDESNIFIDANSHTQYKLKEPNEMDYKTFMSTKIHKYYTPMSMETMIKFMQTHPEAYAVPEMKEHQVEKGYRYLISLVREMEAEEVLDRIVVSLYHSSEFEAVDKIYPFRNKCMRQHGIEPNNYYEMASYCISHGIKAINMSKCFTNDEGTKALIEKGFKIYVALIDYPVEFDRYKERGFHGCVSNWLTEMPPVRQDSCNIQ